MRGKRTDPTIGPSDLDKVWAAGFMDGEGCITVRHATNNLKTGAKSASIFASVTCSQAEPHGGPVMAWFQERWGGALRSKPERKGNAQKAWEWTIVGQQAYAFIADIRPWLRVKGAQADNALLVKDLRKGRGRGNSLTNDDRRMRAEIKAEANRLNARGLTVSGNQTPVPYPDEVI